MVALHGNGLLMRICVSVYMYERERETDRERDRERERLLKIIFECQDITCLTSSTHGLLCYVTQ